MDIILKQILDIVENTSLIFFNYLQNFFNVYAFFSYSNCIYNMQKNLYAYSYLYIQKWLNSMMHISDHQVILILSTIQSSLYTLAILSIILHKQNKNYFSCDLCIIWTIQTLIYHTFLFFKILIVYIYREISIRPIMHFRTHLYEKIRSYFSGTR